MTDQPTDDELNPQPQPSAEEPALPEEAAPSAAAEPPAPWEDDEDETYWEAGAALAEPPEEPRPDWLPPGDEGLPPPPTGRGGSVVSAVLVVLLSLGILACGGWAVMMHRDQQQLQVTLEGALQMMGEGAPPELAQRLEAIRGDLGAGKYEQVGDAISEMHQMLRQGAGRPQPPEAGGPLPPEAYNDLPEDAATFFRSHEDLFRRFLMLCDRARKMRDQGQDVDELRVARDAVIEAARLGQLERVQQRVLAMARMFPGADEGGAGGGETGGGPDEGQRARLQAQAQAFRTAAEKARGQGRDLRAAMGLMQQAEQAAQAGQFDQAAKLLEQATQAANRAPRMARGDLRRGQPLGPPGGRTSAAPPHLTQLVRTLFGLLSIEEQDLRFVWDKLTAVRRDLATPDEPVEPEEPKTPAPDEVEPTPLLQMVDAALGRLQGVSDRRREMSVKLGLNKRPGGRPGEGQPGQPGAGEAMPTREQVMAIVRERLLPLLDRIRALSAEDYDRQKDKLITALIRAVLEPPQKTPEKPATPPTPADPRQQVRDKMLQATPVLRQWQIEGRDTKELDELFTAARRELYGGDVEEAGRLVDEALRKLGLLDPETPPAPAALDRPRPPGAGLADPEATKLRLRP